MTTDIHHSRPKNGKYAITIATYLVGSVIKESGFFLFTASKYERPDYLAVPANAFAGTMRELKEIICENVV